MTSLFDDGWHAGPLFVIQKRRAPKLHSGRMHGIVRRRHERQATPWWADRTEIQKVFLEAELRTRETGELHVVDHIVPLCGGRVCGLHVHWNMRVVHWRENARKGAMFWPGMPFEQMELAL